MLSIKDNYLLVGRVGYAPTTPAMSMQYSTIFWINFSLLYASNKKTNIFNYETKLE